MALRCFEVELELSMSAYHTVTIEAESFDEAREIAATNSYTPYRTDREHDDFDVYVESVECAECCESEGYCECEPELDEDVESGLAALGL